MFKETRQFRAANFHIPFNGEYIHVLFVIFNYHQSAFVFVLNAISVLHSVGVSSVTVKLSKASVFFFFLRLCSETASCIYVSLAVMYHSGCEY